MGTVRLPKRMMGQHASVKRSKVQEAETAKRLGGTVTRGSGAGAFEKADVRVKGLVRVEAKTTKRSSYSVTSELIEKIEAQSLQAGELPAALIEVGNEGQRRSCYVMPVWAVELLLQQAVQPGADQ